MGRNIILQKLAIERCRLHVSHLYAMHHQLDNYDDMIGILVENLNKDFALIEELIGDECC